MNKCIKCGSYAFNLYKEDIDQGGLCDVHYWQGRAHRAEALAQPEQEPSFWLSTLDVETETPIVISHTDKTQGSIYADTCIYPVYTTPPRRTWVGLTNDEVYESYLVDTNMSKEKDWVLMFYEAIEAKLKEKNNA